tara:strand:+ start:87 stop:506 length:420 start_codon:yes stop_codon:yes gene_type:complete
MKHNTKYWIKIILTTIIITTGILIFLDTVYRVKTVHENFKEGLDDEDDDDELEEEELFEDQEDMNAVERTIQSKKEQIQIILQKAKEEERVLTSDEIKKMNDVLKVIERLRQFREILAKHDSGPSVVAKTKSRLGSLFS